MINKEDSPNDRIFKRVAIFIFIMIAYASIKNENLFSVLGGSTGTYFIGYLFSLINKKVPYTYYIHVIASAIVLGLTYVGDKS